MSSPDADHDGSYDTQLSTRIRSGDCAALAEFIERKRHALLAFIAGRTGSQLAKKTDPDDILQDVSVEALRSLATAPLENWNPLNWLFQICERKIIDAHRRYFQSQKRDASREAAIGQADSGLGIADLLAASMTTPSEAFSRDERQLRVLAALDTLPEEHREALRLRYLVGLPSKEIAEKLGKSDGAVRVMLSRSLAKLQELLQD